jgi:hypothetical protein
MLVVVAWPCAVAVAVMSVAVWYWNHHLAALVAQSRCLVARLLLGHLDVCAYHLVRPVAVAVAVSASASAVVSAVPVETSVYQLEAVVRCAFPVETVAYICHQEVDKLVVQLCGCVLAQLL